MTDRPRGALDGWDDFVAETEDPDWLRGIAPAYTGEQDREVMPGRTAVPTLWPLAISRGVYEVRTIHNPLLIQQPTILDSVTTTM